MTPSLRKFFQFFFVLVLFASKTTRSAAAAAPSILPLLVLCSGLLLGRSSIIFPGSNDKRKSARDPCILRRRWRHPSFERPPRRRFPTRGHRRRRGYPNYGRSAPRRRRRRRSRRPRRGRRRRSGRHRRRRLRHLRTTTIAVDHRRCHQRHHHHRRRRRRMPRGRYRRARRCAGRP